MVGSQNVSPDLDSNFAKIMMADEPLVKSVYQKNNFLISQPKRMLWVLKRTVSMRQLILLSTQKRMLKL